MSELRIVSETEDRTVAIGRALGSEIRAGDVVLLHGEMGAGKTCMTRGIALGAECEVSARSPTFIILAEYPGQVRIFHCDLYRITGAADVYDLALDETLDRGALVVEWPENAEGVLPDDALEVRINPDSKTDNRVISMDGSGPNSCALLDRFANSIAMMVEQ
ncbi:MAG: tRNA (adenosine(37)-N6)-threonylcarbamoyltransferase complex ATPase subunit type 1 TsaE [Chloroflexi bacterium]|nr:tRNA (adenosine(37)-N6)-threonylcarbamoyltransferase complex ATPase subunit type 1 TsaE [Chloroflexota bacterium]